MNNKQDSVRIYCICWSQLYLFLNSTISSTILTNCSEIGPLYMTYSQIRSWYAYIRPRNTRERPGSGNDLFCNIAMELILVILKMASRYPLAPFLHERCTGNRSRTMFTWWCGCPNVVAFYIWTVTAFIPPYTCMHFHFRVPIRIPVTYQNYQNTACPTQRGLKIQ